MTQAEIQALMDGDQAGREFPSARLHGPVAELVVGNTSKGAFTRLRDAGFACAPVEGPRSNLNFGTVGLKVTRGLVEAAYRIRDPVPVELEVHGVMAPLGVVTLSVLFGGMVRGPRRVPGFDSDVAEAVARAAVLEALIQYRPGSGATVKSWVLGRVRHRLMSYVSDWRRDNPGGVVLSAFRGADRGECPDRFPEPTDRPEPAASAWDIRSVVLDAIPDATETEIAALDVTLRLSRERRYEEPSRNFVRHVLGAAGGERRDLVRVAEGALARARAALGFAPPGRNPNVL